MNPRRGAKPSDRFKFLVRQFESFGLPKHEAQREARKVLADVRSQINREEEEKA